MSKKEMKAKGVCEFQGFNVSAKNVAKLKVSMRYDEIVTSVNLMQALNTDIDVFARYGGKVERLGMFKLDAITHDKDGNSKITVASMLDNVEFEKIMELALYSQSEITQILFKAVLEIEQKEE